MGQESNHLQLSTVDPGEANRCRHITYQRNRLTAWGGQEASDTAVNRAVGRSENPEGTSSNVVGIICLPG